MSSRRERKRTSSAADNGGIPARLAVMRWAWRLFRREWRGQVLVLALLAIAVAGAVGGATAAYNLAPAEGDAQFGSARHSMTFDEPDSQALHVSIADAEETFDAIDVIGHRFVPVPGLFDPVELRAQAPDGPFSSPMVALLQGRHPTGEGEAAVTDRAAEILEAEIGSTFELGDERFTVVGTVENPSDLHDEFVLVPPFDSAPQDSVTVLFSGRDDDHAMSFSGSGTNPAAITGRPGNEGALAAMVVLIVGTVGLVFVSLVAAAGFIVVAQRRRRQLGMLAAIGATGGHLRLVVLANGAVIGLLAATIGAVVALLGWFAIVPNLETAVGHRIDRFNVPWWLIGIGMLLAVAASVGAAWWPARVVARIPIMSALSGRPSPPRSGHRSVALAGALIVAGAGGLALAGSSTDSWPEALLQIVAIVAFTAGILLISPVGIRALALWGARSSVAVRLAWRDLARYQARSGAALAAISLSVLIATTVVITTSAAVYASDEEGNLSDSQLLIRIGEIPAQGDVEPIPVRTAAEVGQLDALADEMAATLVDSTVIPVDVALAPEIEGFEGLPAVVLATQVDENTFRINTFLHVASPELLEHYGVELGSIDREAEVLTVETEELWFQPVDDELVTDAVNLDPGYSSLPGSFIMPEAMSRRGWEAARAAWLIQASGPITVEQVDQIRDLAVTAGVTVEARDDQADLKTLRTAATLAGTVLALGVLAMTIGLIRGEAANDLRILTATGASGRVRRQLVAATAGGLALLGALLGVIGAYVAVGAVYMGNWGSLGPPPLPQLAVIAIGLPAVAVVSGWLLAGREPRYLARQPID